MSNRDETAYQQLSGTEAFWSAFKRMRSLLFKVLASKSSASKLLMASIDALYQILGYTLSESIYIFKIETLQLSGQEAYDRTRVKKPDAPPLPPK